MSNTNTQLQAIGQFSPEELEVMQSTLAVGTTPAQFGLFVRTAAAAGLNPFLNHIYCIVYGNKMSIQVSVEGILFLAKRVEGYEGIDTQLVHENDAFEAFIDETGSWVIAEHRIKFPRGKVLGCYSIAYRKGFRPYTVFIEAAEVEHHLSGTNAANWKKYYNDFFKKTTTKRAAKGQFGIEISEDETDGGSGVADIGSYERKDITDEANAMKQQPAAAPSQTGSRSRQASPDSSMPPLSDDPETVEPVDPDAEEIAKVRKKISTAFKKLGINTEDGMLEYMSKKAKVKGATPTLAEFKALLKVMEIEIEEAEVRAAAEQGLV